MAKKGSLLAALHTYNCRDYNLEKQKKRQKQAAKKKRAKARRPNSEEKENVEAMLDAPPLVHENESDGWESDERRATEGVAVCREYAMLNIYNDNNRIID